MGDAAFRKKTLDQFWVVLNQMFPNMESNLVWKQDGFTIGIEAVALSTAAEGQQVRVRTGTGKVLNGTVDGKSVRISR